MTIDTSFISLGADHAGFQLKSHIMSYLQDKHYNVQDMGTYNEDAVDYPDIAQQLVHSVISQGGKGILICGTGIGMSIAANRNPQIRAALCHNTLFAKLAREHNDANILVLGARYLTLDEACQIVDTFLSTQFVAGRHEKRVEKLAISAKNHC